MNVRAVVSRLLLLLAAACASSAGIEETPVATVGATPRAEREFRPLLRRWVLGDAAQRQALDENLQAFIKKHQRDDLARLGRVLRAWNALERGNHAEARKLARDAALGPPGVPRDLALLVTGAVERREGKHQRALATLSPLLHKMLDDFATERLNEELTLAAVGARRWPEALRYMEAWLFAAEAADDATVADRVKQLMSQMPNRQLLAALDRRSRDGGNVATTRLLAQQLAVQAVERRDVQLARALLDRYGPLLGRYGEAVARLAIDTAREFVAARTVGVLLSLRTPGLRRRSTDVVAGMSHGLGLPGSQARLVTRDASTGNDVTRALTELASEGAAVVVAGVDPVHSALVAQHAREESLPVILLTPERGGLPSPFVFVIGEPPERTAGQLVAALKSGGSRSVHAAGTSLGGGKELGIAREHPCGALPGEGEVIGVDALVIYDGAECAAEAATLAHAAGMDLAAGLAVPGLSQRPDLELAAGLFPVNEAKPPALVRGWFERRHGPLGWWAALARDAAVLAWAAVHDLSEAKSETREVQARRVEATSALAAARAELWTSEAKGFDRDQRLPRRITLRRKGRAEP